MVRIILFWFISCVNRALNSCKKVLREEIWSSAGLALVDTTLA